MCTFEIKIYDQNRIKASEKKWGEKEEIRKTRDLRKRKRRKAGLVFTRLFIPKRSFHFTRLQPFFLSQDPFSLCRFSPFFFLYIPLYFTLFLQPKKCIVHGTECLFLGTTIFSLLLPKVSSTNEHSTNAVSYHFPSCAIVPGRESLKKSGYEFASHFLREPEWSALFFTKKLHVLPTNIFIRTVSLLQECHLERADGLNITQIVLWSRNLNFPQNLVDNIFTTGNRVLQSISKSRFTIGVSGCSISYISMHKSLRIKYFITQFKAINGLQFLSVF